MYNPRATADDDDDNILLIVVMIVITNIHLWYSPFPTNGHCALWTNARMRIFNCIVINRVQYLPNTYYLLLWRRSLARYITRKTARACVSSENPFSRVPIIHIEILLLLLLALTIFTFKQFVLWRTRENDVVTGGHVVGSFNISYTCFKYHKSTKRIVAVWK